METIGKLKSNNTSKIGMLPSASKYFSIKVLDKSLHIINNKDMLNGLKGSTKMQKRESLFKYKSRIYNVQRNYDFLSFPPGHRSVRCVKIMRW